jgi:hypothetical protein
VLARYHVMVELLWRKVLSGLVYRSNAG